MSDFPFSIPRRGDADVVNGVSYSGDTLTLTRAEGSDLTTTIATGDPVTGVSYSGDTLSLERATGADLTTTIATGDPVTGVSYSGTTLSLERATGADLTTTIATSDPTKIENGTSKMEIATSAGDCVFTPAGLTAKTTTFAADGNVGIGTTDPKTNLHVYDTVNTPSIAFQHLTAGSNAGNDDYLGDLCLHRTPRDISPKNQVGIRSIRRANQFDDQADIEFYVRNGNEGEQIPMVINSTGTAGVTRVGMGTTTPSEQLEVAGNIKCSGTLTTPALITTTGIIRGDGDLDLFANTGSDDSVGFLELRAGSSGTTLGGSIIKFLTNSSEAGFGSEKMRILSTGEVGINETAPSEKLHVDGNIKVTGNILGNGVEIATTSGACVFTPNNNAALATTFFADGKFNVNQQIRFNDLKGIGHAIDFLGLPNIQVGSAYAFANTNVGQTFQRLMSYSKIGNMLNINGHFIFKPTATTGTAYMNYYDIGLAGGIDNKVYIISDLGNSIFTSITADAPNSRLLFNFTVGSGAVNVTQYATLKFFCGLSFRSSYG